MGRQAYVRRAEVYRWVPPETNNAHVRAWLIHERNARRGRPQAQAPRVLGSLPPSLRGHALGGAERASKHDTDCTRAEAQELLALRPTCQDCDTDGGEAAVEDVPSMAPEENLDSDDDCDALSEAAPLLDQFGLKEVDMTAMAETLKGLQRLFELDDEIAVLEAERSRLRKELSGNDELALVAKRLGWRPPKGQRAAPSVVTNSPTPAETATHVFAPGLSRRAKMRQVMAAAAEKAWTSAVLAVAIGEPDKAKTLSTELVDLEKRREIERLRPGVYRWAGGEA